MSFIFSKYNNTLVLHETNEICILHSGNYPTSGMQMHPMIFKEFYICWITSLAIFSVIPLEFIGYTNFLP